MRLRVRPSAGVMVPPGVLLAIFVPFRGPAVRYPLSGGRVGGGSAPVFLGVGGPVTGDDPELPWTPWTARTRSASSCARGGNRSGPRMWGWLPAAACAGYPA